MKIKYAKVSALGDRKENQNWVSVTVSEDAVNMMVFDGMGGHTLAWGLDWRLQRSHRSSLKLKHKKRQEFP